MNEGDDFTFCQVAPTDEPSAPGGGSSTWPTPFPELSLDENSSHIPGGDKNLSPPLWMDKLEDGSVSAIQSVLGSLTFKVGDGKLKAPPAEENTSVSRKAAPRPGPKEPNRPRRFEGRFQQKTCIHG